MSKILTKIQEEQLPLLPILPSRPSPWLLYSTESAGCLLLRISFVAESEPLSSNGSISHQKPDLGKPESGFFNAISESVSQLSKDKKEDDLKARRSF
jgi:hypothetical protein